MKTSPKFLLLSIPLIFFICCKNQKNGVYLALEKFDNSLDSLIAGKTFSKPNSLIFQSDTLYNDPKTVEETCYLFIEKDSMKVDANCHIFRFENNDLIMNSSEDFLGRKFVQKITYFNDKIDNKLLDELRSKKSDTIYFGHLNKYNAKGDLVKKVESSIWSDVQKDGSIIVNENRLLEVYIYNEDNTVTTYRKEYFNKKYHVDSLLNTKTKVFISTKSNTWADDRKNCSYKTDEFGNWVEKRDKRKNADVYYRKYHY